MLYQSALGQTSTWRLALTSTGVPERPLGILSVVVFNLGLAMGSPCCWTAQLHTAVYRADPSHVVCQHPSARSAPPGQVELRNSRTEQI